MKEVAKLQIKDRTELFQATAISMGMQPNVIEKDFWVCFMLDHLFHDCRYKNAFVFKGGTSLSKSYHVIERFSEDIDLILDWRKIINDEVNPWEERSKTKQDIFNKQINSEAAKFYKEELIPQLNIEMKEKLGDGEWISVDTGTRALGMLLVRGLSLVPSPAAKIMARTGLKICSTPCSR